jgi:hypothetical protein
VYLDFARDIGGDADQPVRSGALVLDGEIAARDLGAARGGTAPGLRDHEIAGLAVLRARGRDQQCREGHGVSESAYGVFHASCPFSCVNE